MYVIYEPEIGFKWLPSVVDLKPIKPAIAQWGDSGLHYICWFAHPCSHYITIGDEKERSDRVIAEMKVRKLGKVTPAGATVYPGPMYTQDWFSEAVESIMSLKSIPDFMEVVTLDHQIEAAIRDEKLLKSSSNPDDAAKTIKAKKENQAYLRGLYAQRAEAGERFRKACSHAGLITPDEIWSTI